MQPTHTHTHSLICQQPTHTHTDASIQTVRHANRQHSGNNLSLISYTCIAPIMVYAVINLYHLASTWWKREERKKIEVITIIIIIIKAMPFDAQLQSRWKKRRKIVVFVPYTHNGAASLAHSESFCLCFSLSLASFGCSPIFILGCLYNIQAYRHTCCAAFDAVLWLWLFEHTFFFLFRFVLFKQMEAKRKKKCI